jgi:hypothetical protein
VIIDPQAAEFGGTNLKVVSALRLHKLATIHTSSVSRYLGGLESQQRAIVRQFRPPAIARGLR